jgi:hypothetical protein
MMIYRAFNLVRFALELWTASLLLLFLFDRRKLSREALRNRFSWDAVRNWKREQVVRSFFRATAAFLFHSGLFVLVVVIC